MKASIYSLYRELVSEARTVQGASMTDEEIKDAVMAQIKTRLEDADVMMPDEVNIVDLAITGSRGRGTARDDSDLDVVLAYTGTMREDDLYNILHDPDYEDGEIFVDGFTVDVNPVHPDKSGTLEQVLKKHKEYDKEILAKLNK